MKKKINQHKKKIITQTMSYGKKNITDKSPVLAAVHNT